MKNTIKRIFKMNEVLVDVLVYLDSTKQSNTLIRSQVDRDWETSNSLFILLRI